MKPIVHGLEAEYWGEVDIVYIDNDDLANRGIRNRYGVLGQPTFILVDADGEEIERWFGSVDRREFREAFDAALAAQE